MMMKAMMIRTVAHCKQKAVSKIFLKSFFIIFLVAERDESMIISIFLFFQGKWIFLWPPFHYLISHKLRLIVEKFELGE